jgi:hypothetical protein
MADIITKIQGVVAGIDPALLAVLAVAGFILMAALIKAAFRAGRRIRMLIPLLIFLGVDIGALTAFLPSVAEWIKGLF